MSRILQEAKLYKFVGECIRNVRRSCTPLVRQEDVAIQSDGQLSRSSVANIEGGRQGITLHQLYRIADILNVEPKELLPERQTVFERAAETLEDSGKREWLTRVLQDESTSKGKKK